MPSCAPCGVEAPFFTRSSGLVLIRRGSKLIFSRQSQARGARLGEKWTFHWQERGHVSGNMVEARMLRLFQSPVHRTIRCAVTRCPVGRDSKWHRNSAVEAQRAGMPSGYWLTSLFEATQDKIFARGAPREWFAVARTSRPETPDALQGFHASDIRVSDDGHSIVENSMTMGPVDKSCSWWTRPLASWTRCSR